MCVAARRTVGFCKQHFNVDVSREFFQEDRSSHLPASEPPLNTSGRHEQSLFPTQGNVRCFRWFAIRILVTTKAN